MVIIIVANHHNDALIRIIFMVASYTYGPILGLFAFGMFTKREIPKQRRGLVPVSALAIPAFCYVLANFKIVVDGLRRAFPLLRNVIAPYKWEGFFGYNFGYELLIVNGLLVFGALMVASEKAMHKEEL